MYAGLQAKKLKGGAVSLASMLCWALDQDGNGKIDGAELKRLMRVSDGGNGKIDGAELKWLMRVSDGGYRIKPRTHSSPRVKA